MNKITSIFLTILAFSISLILVIMESSSYVYYDAQNIYRIYLNGESIGVIENKKELEDYIDKMQTNIKSEYNVDKVYSPNGLKMEKETTYNERLNTPEEIYNQMKDKEDFTIDGYIVTITDKKETKNDKDEVETKKIKEYIYLLDKEILQDSVDSVVRAFVNDEEYENYLNEIEKNKSSYGKMIENVYVKEQISIKKGRIPVNTDIYRQSKDLANYLLFGTNKKAKTYKVKTGDTIKKIAYNNKMSTEEFLIANQDITDENALLYEGQQVVINYINPVITIIEETHSVNKEKIRYKTVEKKDDSLMPGHTIVIQKGKKGISKVTRKIKKQNGKIIEALIVSSEVITEPISKIVRTGGDANWAWPTTSNYTITTYFGYQLRSDIGESASRLHDGIDVAGLGCNTPIYAAAGGTVKVAGWYQGYGIGVIIDHGKGYQTLYGHLNSTAVSVGQRVSTGQQIGRMGNTGYSYGCHLHFSLLYNGSFTNPLVLYQ